MKCVEDENAPICWIRYFVLTAAIALLLLFCPDTKAFAIDDSAESISETEPYYLGSVVNTGTDNGFRGSQTLRSGDPHFGWEIGKFYATGYVSVQDDDIPRFMVPSGQSLKLWFVIEQDVGALGGDPGLSISEDTNGRDEEMEIAERNFGRGALLIKNLTSDEGQDEVRVIPDFLISDTEVDIPIEVGQFKQGSYSVSLDYEIREDALVLFGLSILPTFTNYKIAFSFQVADAVNGLESGAVMQSLNSSGKSVEEGEAFDEEIASSQNETGMPFWQIGIIVLAIAVSSVFVIRGERKSNKK